MSRGFACVACLPARQATSTHRSEKELGCLRYFNKMKLLLHVCCAPCMIHPLEELKRQGFEVSAIFYNPNIHPFSEYERRRGAIARLIKEANSALEIFYPEYDPADFFEKINFREPRQERCRICWQLRLGRSAQAAKERGCEYFSTTLLVSPYQDQESLKEIGERAGEEAGVRFHAQDFRQGFKEAHAYARGIGLYCQKYCGCLYSQVERFNEKKKKWERR